MDEKTHIPGAPLKHIHQPITEERRRVFLDALSRTGIFVWAARAASPHSSDASNKGCASSFRDLEKRDPTFAAQVAEAREIADASIEQEAYRRAVEGVPEKIYQRGVQAVDADGKPAFVQRYSDRLLERLLETRMPHKWTPRKGIEVSGSVSHSHTGSVLHLSVEDVLGLGQADRDELGRIMGLVAVNRGEIESTAIEVTPEPEPLALPVADPEQDVIR